MPTFPQSVVSELFREKAHQKYLALGLLLMTVQITLFKILYPYADFFSDSYSYIYAAIAGLNVNLWPIGYSKFILLFHQISHSDTALVVFQYFLIQLSTLYLLLTIFYYYRPGKMVSNILFYVLMLNPVIPYLSNYISSDGLFLALSLCWAAQLITMLHKPTILLLLVHTILIAVAFTVRYNAIYYPIISALAYLLSGRNTSYKTTGILLPILLMGLFINYTSNETKKYTGTKEFSVFGGWQLANNALYMYPHIEMNKTPPAACAEFHQTVLQFFQKAGPQMKNLRPSDGAFYLRDQNAPLKVYLAKKMGAKEDSSGGIQSWGSVSPIYASYGKFLSKNYPVAFIRYFILPNALNYWLPPIEKLSVYNLGSYRVYPIAQYWFDYPKDEVRAVSLNAQKAILMFFPALFGALNFIFLWAFFSLLRGGKFKAQTQGFKTVLLLVTCLLLVNAAFGILASPIVFRYLVFPMVLLIIFSGVVIEKLELSDK